MKSYAQAGQDEWVHSIIGDSGYFVDVGAHDGIVHSNTYALEQLGWTGICVEPNVEAFSQLLENRPDCTSSNLVVGAERGNVGFDGVRVNESGPVRACLPLAALLVAHEAPDVIDYLSIDVEGHELQVLAGMDFDRWTVRCLTIEHNLYSDGPARKDAIYGHLHRFGFIRVRENVIAPGYGEYEDWYMSRDD